MDTQAPGSLKPYHPSTQPSRPISLHHPRKQEHQILEWPQIGLSGEDLKEEELRGETKSPLAPGMRGEGQREGASYSLSHCTLWLKADTSSRPRYSPLCLRCLPSPALTGCPSFPQAWTQKSPLQRSICKCTYPCSPPLSPLPCFHSQPFGFVFCLGGFFPFTCTTICNHLLTCSPPPPFIYQSL